VEAVLFDGTNYPSARVFAAAKKHVFRVMLAPQVEEEARRALASYGKEYLLDDLLAQCLVVRCPAASPMQLKRYKGQVWAHVKHEADAIIGVAIRCSRARPVFFVSSNNDDWRPSPQATEALNGCEIVRSRTFVNRINP
jgi:hypothetical protein